MRLWRLLLPACASVLATVGAAGQPGAAAGDDPAVPTAADAPVVVASRAVQRTALATRPDLRFVLLRQAGGSAIHTTLAWQPEAAVPLPVAQLVQSAGDPAAPAVVRLLRGPMPAGQPRAGLGVDAATVALATLEQLYTLLLRQPPEARYCIQGPDAQAEGCTGPALGHAEALRALADRRSALLADAPTARPWQVVRLQATAAVGWDADAVAVQAVGPLGPLADLPVHFHRAPHSLCQARTGADGVARCRLLDPHDDGHQHDHAAAVVVSYPGDVAPQQVRLPTTQVLRLAPDAGAPAFASRWAWPVMRPAP